MRSGSRTFEAKYGGRCGYCDTRFGAGDPVRYHDDEVCHEDCALEAEYEVEQQVLAKESR